MAGARVDRIRTGLAPLVTHQVAAEATIRLRSNRSSRPASDIELEAGRFSNLTGGDLVYPPNRSITKQAFCPPNPKLFDSATSTFVSRATFGM